MHLAFLLICLFTLITTFGLTDHALLVGQQVHVPVLDVRIPLRGFFHVAAAVVALSHLSVLVQGAFLARDLLALRRREGRTLPDSALTIYPFVQYLRNPRSRALRGVLSLLVNTSIVCLGCATLLAMQLRMLAWQDEALNWAFRGWLLLDVLCIALLWPRVLYPKHSAGAIWRHWLFGGAQRIWRLAYWLITISYLAYLVFSVGGLDTPLSVLPLLLGPLVGLMALRGWRVRLRILLLGLLPCTLGLLLAAGVEYVHPSYTERSGFSYLTLSGTAITAFVGGLFWWWVLPVMSGRKMRGARLLPLLVLCLPLPSLALLTRGEQLELTLTHTPRDAIYDVRRETAYTSLFSRWRALDVSGTRIAGENAEQPLVIKGRSLLGLQAQGVQMRHVALVNSALSGADFSGAVIRDSGVDINGAIRFLADDSEWSSSDLSLAATCLDCSFERAIFDHAQFNCFGSNCGSSGAPPRRGMFLWASFLGAQFSHSMLGSVGFEKSGFAAAEFRNTFLLSTTFSESAFARHDMTESATLDRVLMAGTRFQDSQLWARNSATQLVFTRTTVSYPDDECARDFLSCIKTRDRARFDEHVADYLANKPVWLQSAPVPPVTAEASGSAPADDCLSRQGSNTPFACRPFPEEGRLVLVVPWLADELRDGCTANPLLLEKLLASQAYGPLVRSVQMNAGDVFDCATLNTSAAARQQFDELMLWDEFQRRYRSRQAP